MEAMLTGWPLLAQSVRFVSAGNPHLHWSEFMYEVHELLPVCAGLTYDPVGDARRFIETIPDNNLSAMSGQGKEVTRARTEGYSMAHERHNFLLPLLS